MGAENKDGVVSIGFDYENGLKTMVTTIDSTLKKTGPYSIQIDFDDKGFSEGIKQLAKYSEALAKVSEAADTFNNKSTGKSNTDVAKKTAKQLDSARAAFQKYNNIIETTYKSLDKFRNSVANDNATPKYTQSINELVTALQKMRSIIGDDADTPDVLSLVDKQTLSEQISLIKQLTKLLDSDKLNWVNKSGTLIADATDYEKAIEYLKSLGNVSDINVSGIKNGFQEITATLNAGTDSAQELKLTFDKDADAYRQLVTEVSKSQSTFSKLGSAIKGSFPSVTGILSTYLGLSEAIQAVKSGISTVTTMNSALTEMRKVSDETTNSLKELQAASFDMADNVGTTAASLDTSIADWMRLGETLEEATESAELSNVLLNVSEFESIDDATNALVSISQAYKDLEKSEIIDVLNAVGKVLPKHVVIHGIFSRRKVCCA